MLYICRVKVTSFSLEAIEANVHLDLLLDLDSLGVLGEQSLLVSEFLEDVIEQAIYIGWSLLVLV